MKRRAKRREKNRKEEEGVNVLIDGQFRLRNTEESKRDPDD